MALPIDNSVPVFTFLASLTDILEYLAVRVEHLTEPPLRLESSRVALQTLLARPGQAERVLEMFVVGEGRVGLFDSHTSAIDESFIRVARDTLIFEVVSSDHLQLALTVIFEHIPRHTAKAFTSSDVERETIVGDDVAFVVFEEVTMGATEADVRLVAEAVGVGVDGAVIGGCGDCADAGCLDQLGWLGRLGGFGRLGR